MEHAMLSGRPTTWLKEVWGLLRDSFYGWMEDNAPRKGAALAFYTIFSLAPILVLAIAIAGLFLGEEAARGEIVEQIGGLVGRDGAQAIETMIENAHRPGTGILATLVGIGTLIVGATTVLAELKRELDEIWDVPPERRSGFWYFISTRLLSFGFILALAFLLLVSLVLSAALAALARYIGGDAEIVLRVLNVVLSFTLAMTLFATIYKLLPSVRIGWRDVLIGAAATSLLFNVGKSLISTYLGNSAITSTYGAAGSVILVLLWVYYSTQIFLMGAEFTRVYTERYGSRCPAARAQRAGEARSLR